METDQGEQWVCASCGARHDENDPPCRNCAGEQFARLENPSTPRITDTASVTWACTECGTKSPRNGTPCETCGSFSYERVDESSTSTSSTNNSSVPGSGTRDITLRWLLCYIFGIPVGLIGLGSIFVLGELLIGTLYTLSAAVAMPYSRTRIERRFNINLSTGAVAAIVVVLYATAGYFVLLYL